MKKASITRWAARASLALLATAALSTASVLAADLSAGPPAMKVRFGDLDLASARGIAVLYRRIAAAADNVCGPRVVTGSLIPRPSFVICRKKAIAAAIATIGRRELTQYYRRQEGDQPVRAAAVGAHGSSGG